jgi:Fic-DOC domain mobile mystery protein B
MSEASGKFGPFSVSAIGPEPDGATPIKDEDLAGLIPDFVATRADLNQVEYENIAKALPWANAQASRRGPMAVLDQKFLFALHEHMFGDVWRWAGTRRRRVTNIGVDPGQIVPQVADAIDDARYWHENDISTKDERAVRLHFRLVCIHPFPNGNGRCTRLMADLYLASIGTAPFTWGASQLGVTSVTRAVYIAALIAAPLDDCVSLLEFARS